MTRKVLCLETAVKEREKNGSSSSTVNDPKYETSEKEIEKKKEGSGENISFNHNDLRGTTSTPKGKDDNNEKLDSKEKMLSCKECDYSCKKEKTLKNHMLSKHEIHHCKDCHEELPNSMQLLKHVAKHHTDIQSNTNDIQLEEEALKKDPLEELEAELSALKKELS